MIFNSLKSQSEDTRDDLNKYRVKPRITAQFQFFQFCFVLIYVCDVSMFVVYRGESRVCIYPFDIIQHYSVTSNTAQTLLQWHS